MKASRGAKWIDTVQRIGHTYMSCTELDTVNVQEQFKFLDRSEFQKFQKS